MVSPVVTSCSFMSRCTAIEARYVERVLARRCVPPIPIPACRVSDSPAPPGLSLEAPASHGSRGAYLLHGIFGMAWLCSARWGCSSTGRACFVSTGLVVLLMVRILLTVERGWGFFLLRGFHGYLVMELG